MFTRNIFPSWSVCTRAECWHILCIPISEDRKTSPRLRCWILRDFCSPPAGQPSGWYLYGSGGNSHHSGDGNHSSGGRLRHGNETGTAKALPPDHFNQTLYSGGHGNGHPLYGTPAHWHKPACGHRHHHLHVSAGTFQHADLFEKRGRKCLCFHHQLPLLHRDDTDLCDGSGEGCVVIFYST